MLCSYDLTLFGLFLGGDEFAKDASCSPGNYPQTKYGTKPCEDVAVRGVEGDVVAEAVSGGQCIGLVAGNALAHAAVGVDGRGDAVVGVAENPAAVFDGTHARHIQVLPRGAGVAVPSVIADVDEDLCAETRELPHLVGEDGFIADENSVAMAVEAEDFALVAGRALGDFSGELAGKEEEAAEGNVFAEGDEVDFVVTAKARAVA